MNNVKRKNELIELHCHTKMSAKKGLIGAGDLVRYAYDKGYKAIAITDCNSVQAFPEAYITWKKLWNKYEEKCRQAGIEADKEKFLKIIYGMEGYLINENGDIYSVLILVKNQKGLRNLYELMSRSRIEHYISGKALLPKGLIAQYREGLLIGSCCVGGEVFKAICSAQKVLGSVSDREYRTRIKAIIEYYDFLEIVPFERTSVNDSLLERYMYFASIKIGTRPMAVSSDAYYIEEEDGICWDILTDSEINVDRPRHMLNYDDNCMKFFQRWHAGMPKEFRSLPNRIIKDRNLIADQIEYVVPVRQERIWPQYPDADNELISVCTKRVKELFGDQLNTEVKERLQRELDAIIGNGYAGLYLMWKRLIEKSHEDGYPTMSRGAVGSSLVAYLCGITEINPLSEQNGGYDIPEEVFMGINLNKTPDIDISFTEEIQEKIQEYTNQLPGVELTCKAGTTAAYNDLKMKRIINDYLDKNNMPTLGRKELGHMINVLSGIKTEDGVHSGGVMIIPEGEDVYSITPLKISDYRNELATHFEYHYLDDSILKFDILGFRYLDRLHYLIEKTGVNLENIPLDDEKIISRLCDRKIKSIADFPEFGCEGTRKIIFDAKPDSFGGFVKVCALSHGMNVWKDNQDALFRNKTITLNDCISSREDIMLYLIDKGVSKMDAYDIMKSVYRGKGLKKNHVEMMREYGILEWYIGVCGKIRYLFPKAHAVSYTRLAFQMAYFLIYYPKEYKDSLSIF